MGRVKDKYKEKPQSWPRAVVRQSPPAVSETHGRIPLATGGARTAVKRLCQRLRDVRLTGMVTPRIARIRYVVDIKRVLLPRLNLAIAGGVVKADGEIVCSATDVTV